MSKDDEADLLALERQRCAALMDGNETGLAALLTENLVHIHLTGAVDDKAGYLHGFRHKYTFREITRGPLTVRVFKDAAVMTGTLHQRIDVRETGAVMDVAAMTTQVWSRSGKSWLLNTCHNAPLAKPAD